jgi:hypothetical protein
MQEFWFPILLVVMLVLGIGFSFKCAKGDDAGVLGVIFLGFILVLLLILWPIRYISSIGDIADMRAFVDSTKSAYEYTITSTQEVEIKAVSLAEPSAYEILDAGELAYLKLGSQAGERIKEFRSKIEWYNETLERYKRFNAFCLTQGFIANVPPDMMPIILK